MDIASKFEDKTKSMERRRQIVIRETLDNAWMKPMTRNPVAAGGDWWVAKGGQRTHSQAMLSWCCEAQNGVILQKKSIIAKGCIMDI